MMFALMTQEERLSIPRMCELLHLSRASYYRWRDRKETPDNDMELRDLIQWIVLHRNRYGYRRVTKELARSYECMVNHKKVLRLMREDNLLCLRKRGWVKTTIQGRCLLNPYRTQTGPCNPVHPPRAYPSLGSGSPVRGEGIYRPLKGSRDYHQYGKEG